MMMRPLSRTLEGEAMLPSNPTTGGGRSPARFFLAALGCATLLACQPTVQLEAPKEPITINLNIKIDAEVRVKLEEKAREDIETNPEVF